MSYACHWPVSAQIIPCPFLLTSVSQDADLSSPHFSGCLAHWLLVSLAKRGIDGRLEDSISGRDCIYSLVKLLLVTLYHDSNSGCTVHPVVLEVPPLTSRSCHISWFLGSHDTVSLPFVFFPRAGSSFLQLLISEMPHFIFRSAKAL